MVVKSDDFTRLHITDELSSDHIEGASFAGDHIAVTDTSYSQRVEAVLVPACVDTSSCHDHEGESTVNLIKSILDRLDTRQFPVDSLFLDEMGKNLGIRRRLEKAALVLKLVTKLSVIYDLTVVSHREVSRVVMEKKRLDILRSLASRIAVTDMTDGHPARKL